MALTSGPSGAVSHNASGWKKISGTGDPDLEVWSPGMAGDVDQASVALLRNLKQRGLVIWGG